MLQLLGVTLLSLPGKAYARALEKRLNDRGFGKGPNCVLHGVPQEYRVSDHCYEHPVPALPTWQLCSHSWTQTQTSSQCTFMNLRTAVSAFSRWCGSVGFGTHWGGYLNDLQVWGHCSLLENGGWWLLYLIIMANREWSQKAKLLLF